MLRAALWEHILLYVARLTDEPGEGPRTTLTLRRLPDDIEGPALREEVRNLLVEAEEKWTPVRKLRNKWLAHLDLRVWTDAPDAEELPEMDDQALENALLSMRQILTRIEDRYSGAADRRYEPLRLFGDADHLVFSLRNALKLETERRQRARSGLPLRRRSDFAR